MKTLTNQERLILINQFRILEKLDPTGIDPEGLGRTTYKKFRVILENGYKFHYSDIFGELPEELPASVCEEIHGVFRMYSALQFSYKNLEDKNGINRNHLKFINYDDKNENREWGYVNSCTDGLEEYKGVLESKMECQTSIIRPTYKRMLEIWNKFDTPYSLSANEIKELLDELPSCYKQ